MNPPVERFLFTILRGGPDGLAWDFHNGGLKFETPCLRQQRVGLLGRAHLMGLASVVYLSCVVCELLHMSGVYLFIKTKEVPFYIVVDCMNRGCLVWSSMSPCCLWQGDFMNIR